MLRNILEAFISLEAMRFKAKITRDQGHMLHQATSSLERIAKGAILHLSKDAFKMSMIVNSPDVLRGFAELDTKVIFQELRIESQSDNAILLKIDNLHLLTYALSSVKRATGICQIKLVKRGDRPNLCIEARTDGGMDEVGSESVTQNVPIKVLPVEEVIHYLPPAIPLPNVALQMPNKIKILRSVIEKTSKFDKHMYIGAKQAGTMTLRVEDDLVSVQTHISDLLPARLEEVDMPDIHNSARVKVDIRKLSVVLGLQHLPWDDANLYFCDNAALYIQVSLTEDGASLDFFVPVLVMDSSD